jgi:1-acyl-sn-glycerol-3-phosphate acyltransferase
MDVEWQAPLPPGAKILAANHPTTTDPFYLLSLTPEPVSVLVTEAAFQVPVFGRYLRAAGHVPAVRQSGGATVESLRRKLQDGRPVAIFPEGALSPCEGGCHPAHTGVARLALSTGVPVVPIGIGLDRTQVRPFSVEIDGHVEAGRLCLRGRYAVTVGQPMWLGADGQDAAAARRAAAQVMQRIGQLASQSACRVGRVREPQFQVPRPARAEQAR